ncbi:MAG: VacJ family lipoprotein [Desulfovibrionaceae bacterium]
MKFTRTLLALAFVLLLVQTAPAASGDGAGTITASQLERTTLAQFDPISNGEYNEVWDAQGNVVAEGQQSVVDQVPDPLEGWNRFWFHFNDKVYFYLAKPITQAYKWAIPERPRRWVGNFFHNLLFPVRFVNCLLQGKGFEAGVEFSRFIGNTAFGLGGLDNPADRLQPTHPISSTDEDFGQTLGAWGAGDGMYLVWPFLGPSSARDTVGYVGDYFLKPVSYIHPWYWSVATTAYEKINDLSFRLGEYETVKEGAIDPYVALKSAYLRLRAKKVQD